MGRRERGRGGALGEAEGGAGSQSTQASAGNRGRRAEWERGPRTASARSSFFVAPAGAAPALATRLTRVAALVARASDGCGRARPGVKPSAVASARARATRRSCMAWMSGSSEREEDTFGVVTDRELHVISSRDENKATRASCGLLKPQHAPLSSLDPGSTSRWRWCHFLPGCAAECALSALRPRWRPSPPRYTPRARCSLRTESACGSRSRARCRHSHPRRRLHQRPRVRCLRQLSRVRWWECRPWCTARQMRTMDRCRRGASWLCSW